MLIKIILTFTLAYLLGSIPFGYLIALLFKIDIRQHGSGNIGATNVFRTLGPLAGAMVFLLDLLKGTLAVVATRILIGDAWFVILAALAVVIGHSFSIFLKFKGGRGAATSLGTLLGVAPDIFVVAALLVAAIIYITRYVSVASITVPILVTLAMYFLNRPLPYTIACALVSALIIIRHIPNIKRLLAGTESKVGIKK
jgi:glycerol-3-phosphate acyltransferase PlsY